MRMLYVSRRALRLAGIYAAAVALLLAGAGLFSPAGREVLAEPYRSGPAESAMVSLAINVDWGGEYIPQILEILDRYGIKATFFLTGRWTDSEPELAKAITEAGHEIGNHGYSHSSPNASSVAEIVHEIERTAQSIKEATGVDTRLYTPPSGESESHVVQAAEEAGHYTTLWSVDTIDWQRPEPEVIVERVMDKIHGGAIILAHPTDKTVLALPQIIEQVKAKGYNFVTVSENLGL